MAEHRIEPVRERPSFQRIALLLQGGGALGSYQGGVYQALAEANIHPDCVAGISIGAINAALIAGNPPERRVEMLRQFWETVTEPPPGMLPLFAPLLSMMASVGNSLHLATNRAYALGNVMGGAPGFFTPRAVPLYMLPSHHLEVESFYDISPLRTTLESLVDFDRINAKSMRLCVGAVNVKSGNMRYFDSDQDDLTVDHVIASGSLPPGFPATLIEGESIGTADFSPIRRWNGCSIPGRAWIRWPSRSICGTRSAMCRRI